MQHVCKHLRWLAKVQIRILFDVLSRKLILVYKLNAANVKTELMWQVDEFSACQHFFNPFSRVARYPGRITLVNKKTKNKTFLKLPTSVQQIVGHNGPTPPHLYNPSASRPAERKPSRPGSNTVRPRSDNEHRRQTVRPLNTQKYSPSVCTTKPRSNPAEITASQLSSEQVSPRRPRLQWPG